MQLARIWNLVAGCLDGEVWASLAHKTVVWMPAHGSRASIGRAVKSDGSAVSWVDWRSNRLVDVLAKAAAHRWAVPERAKRFVRNATSLYEFSAGLVGNTAYASNHFARTELTDDGAVTKTLRDSLPPPKRQRAPYLPRRAGPPEHQATAAAPAPSGAAAAAQQKKATRQRGSQAANEARFIRTWHLDLASRVAAPREGPTASERLAALRLRVLSRKA